MRDLNQFGSIIIADSENNILAAILQRQIDEYWEHQT